MSDAKPFASLGATLLARKGSAKPAMRPQASRVAVNGHSAAQNLEDLGWDDMGDEDNAADHSADVLRLTPSPHNKEAEALTDTASPKPKVRSMHEELALRLAEEQANANPASKTQTVPLPVPAKKQALTAIGDEFDEDEDLDEFKNRSNVKPITAAPAAPTEASKAKPQAANDSRRAAFTLRLDARRHLKLRLASTVRGRSAQQLVTEALDRFLDQIPEIEALAAQVKRD